MNRIRILDESVSNAIAAGEVVENPTSMIKELIENSLDAGSKEIKLEVWNGGLDICISDSGCGMSKEDLLLSIERHATSKITTKDDLFNIRTYGFRGEALSSIASVSKMILSSRTEDSPNGTQMNVLGGKVTNLKDIQKNVGTQIEIKDLFYNTPARKKFLRKDTTEYLNIKDIFLREALANPNVKFILNIEGKESIRTSGNGIENAILEIFGKNYLKNFSKFSLGYLGNANLFKANKDSIFVFINGRSVKSKIVEEAVIAAYHTKLMKGKYPSALIFLDIDPAEIDVNVHPSKKIVKFANQSEIYDLVKGEIEKFFSDDENFISPHIEVEDEEVLIDFVESGESSFENELIEKHKTLKYDIEEFEVNLLLDGEYDMNNAIVTIHSGAGGTEACDWADMLYRMYLRWCNLKNYKVSELDFMEGDSVGVKSVTFLVEGINAYGYLKSEKGVHRLVRISPFDANKKRHTSFASVEVVPEVDDNVEVEINPADIRIDTYRASGAGGQHVNMTDSAVRITHFPTGVVVTCQKERSQLSNRETAMKMLKSKLLEIELKKKEEEMKKIQGEQTDIGWGNQIRSYVFQPYALVKDHRTNTEIGNVKAVMDGSIDDFINSYLKWIKNN